MCGSEIRFVTTIYFKQKKLKSVHGSLSNRRLWPPPENGPLGISYTPWGATKMCTLLKYTDQHLGSETLNTLSDLS